jgi:hypothetical protein
LKSTIEVGVSAYKSSIGFLNPNPPSVIKIFSTPPLVVSPTYAIAPIGLFAVGFKPPTIVTGSPSTNPVGVNVPPL